MVPSFIEVRGDLTQDLEHLATLKPDTLQYPPPASVCLRRRQPAFVLCYRKCQRWYLKDSQSLLKTESLHTYFQFCLSKRRYWRAGLLSGSPGCMWSIDWTSLCPCPLTGTQSQGLVHKQIKAQLCLFQKNSCLPRREKSASKQVLEGEHVLPALEWTRSRLKLENFFFFFLHHCDETWGPFSAVGATLVDTACLRGPGKGTWWNTALGSWDPDEPSLTAAG